MATLWTGSFAALIAGALSNVFLARVLSPDALGVFTSALAIVTLAGLAAAFGVPDAWLKLFGAEGPRAQRWLPASARLLAGSITVATASVGLWAWFGPHERASAIALLAMTPVVMGIVVVSATQALNQVKSRHAIVSAYGAAGPFARLFVVVVLVLLPVGVGSLHVAIGFGLVGALLGALAGWHILCMTRRGVSQTATEAADVTVPRARDLILLALPFAVAAVLAPVYTQGGTVWVKYLAGDEAAGHFGLAASVLIAVYLMPGIFYQRYLLTKLHAWTVHQPFRIHQVFRYGGLGSLTMGLGIAVAVAFTAPNLFLLMFGEAYQPAGELLVWLAWAIPLRFLAANTGAILSTGHHISTKVRIMGVVVLISVLSNVSLVPVWGAKGAAVAVIVSEFSLCVLFIGHYLRATRYNGAST